MYRPMIQTAEQRIYTIGDLESLSASALYTGKVNISKVATTESIQLYDNGAIKTYVNPITNEVLAREQAIHQKHQDEMETIFIDKAIK